MKEKKLSIKGVLFFLIIYVALNLALSYFVQDVRWLVGIFNGWPKNYIFGIVFLFQEFIFLLLLLISFYISSKKLNFPELIKKFIAYFKLKFKRIGWKSFFKYTIGYFFLYFAIITFLHVVFTYFGIDIPGFFGKQEISSVIANLKIVNVGDFLLMFFCIVLLGPLMEELIYRGFIQEIFIQRYPTIFAIILPAFIFAFMHFDFGVIGNLFILSLFISYIYYKTRSLYVTLGFHMLINSLALLALIFT